jgi:hypothetical protein
MAIADFNGDGSLDVALSGSPSGIVILLGNGDGTFRPGIGYAASPYTSAMTVGDFNGDGKPDIAVADYPQLTFSVFINKGDGTFNPPVTYGGPSQQVAGIASGDFDGDGRRDIAMADPYGGVMIWLNRGDGTFTDAGRYTAGAGPIAIGAVDLNGDHRDDLVIANRYSNDVSSLVSVTRFAAPQPASVTFPDQITKTMGPFRTVTVTNNGTADLHLAMANVTGPNARDFAKVGDTCSGTAIPAGGNCNVLLRFAPTGVGSRVARLQVTDDAVDSAQLVPLSGTGLPRNPAGLPAGPVTNRGLPPPPPPSAPTLPSTRRGWELQPVPRLNGGELLPLTTLTAGGELQPLRLLRLLLL